MKNLTTTAYNATPVGRGHDNASNNKIKGYFWTLRGFTRVVRSVLMSPTHLRVYRTRPNLFFLLFSLCRKFPLILYDNNEKIILKLPNCLLTTLLKFWSFHHAFEMQKGYTCPDQFVND